MARTHGRVYSAIWQDTDFLALDSGPQRLYMLLLSQSNLTHLGVLALTERRWAKTAADYNAETVRTELSVLEAARFVVVDEDSEELLVRTLMRNDNVYKQPNTLKAAIASAPTITSHRIKRALLAEVGKIDLKDVEEAKRDGIRTDLTKLADAIAVPLDMPSPNPPSGHAEDIPDVMPEPPTRARTHAARAQPLPLAPSPAPTENTCPAVPDEPVPLTLVEAPSPHKITQTPPGFDTWWDLYPRKQAKPRATRAYVKAVASVGPSVLLAGLERYLALIRQDRTDRKYIPLPASWLNDERWTDDLRPARSEHSPSEEWKWTS